MRVTSLFAVRLRLFRDSHSSNGLTGPIPSYLSISLSAAFFRLVYDGLRGKKKKKKKKNPPASDLRPQSCLAQRTAHASAGEGGEGAATSWKLYMNLQSNLVPPSPDAGPYTRPLSRLRHSCPVPSFIEDQYHVASLNLWIGRGAAKSQLHNDAKDNMYVLLRGQKRFRLYPPSEVASVRTVFPPLRVSPAGKITYANKTKPHEFGAKSGVFSSLWRTDLPQSMAPFPQHNSLLQKKVFEVVLNPGEMLYIPAYWFHEVESIGDEGHVAVNIWFDAPEDIDARVTSAHAGGSFKQCGDDATLTRREL